jgi:type I restriction enzyme S subunit
MKEGWELKKIKEVADVFAGQGAPRGDSNYCLNGIPFVKAGNLSELINGKPESSIQNVSEQVAKTHKLKLYKAGSVLFAKSGMSCMKGYVYTLKKDCYVVSHLAIITPISVDSHFLNYYLCFNKPNTLIKDSAYPSISLKDIENLKIPVPTASEQQRIVEELDLLSSIIEKKKEQLKELDNLAQSIFYDMFGDPVTNEKGWEVKKLGEVCNKITDGTHNSPINTEKGDFMYITAKNIKKDGISLENVTFVSADVHKSIYDRCNPQYGDVLYIKDGVTTGIATVNTIKEEFSLLSSVALLKPGKNVINRYLKAVLNEPRQYLNIRENMGGAAITRLTIAKIFSIKIPVPPLSLQQSFAAKIESIEKQKAAISKSIAETEKLFEYTMDSYFG